MRFCDVISLVFFTMKTGMEEIRSVSFSFRFEIHHGGESFSKRAGFQGSICNINNNKKIGSLISSERRSTSKSTQGLLQTPCIKLHCVSLPPHEWICQKTNERKLRAIVHSCY